MKIDRSTVTKLVITEVKSLDPVTVILEDIAPRKGKIIIECWGKSWAASWGGMGGNTIAQFFCSCDQHYLAKNLSDIDSDVVDADSIKDGCRKQVLTDRRRLDLSKHEARDLFDEIESAITGDDGWADPKLMQKVFGEEWWYRLPSKPNPDYAYLCRIISAVQSALAQCEQPENEAVASATELEGKWRKPRADR